MISDRDREQALTNHLSAAEREEFLAPGWHITRHAMFSAGKVVLRRQQPPATDALNEIRILNQAAEGDINDTTPRYFLASILALVGSLESPSAISAFKMEYRGHVETWYFNTLNGLLTQIHSPLTVGQLLAGDRETLYYHAYALAERIFRRWGEAPARQKRDALDRLLHTAIDTGYTANGTCQLLVGILGLLGPPLDEQRFIMVLRGCLDWTSRVIVRHEKLTDFAYRLRMTLDQTARDSIGDQDVGFDLPSTHSWHFFQDKAPNDQGEESPWMKFDGADTIRGDQPWVGILHAGGWRAQVTWNNAKDERRFRGIDGLTMALRSIVVAMLASHATAR